MAGISGTQKKLGVALSLVVAVLVLGGVAAVFPTASNQGYAPEQPIPFSHKIHAGDNKIACNYCHTGVETSRHATIPAMNVCMNCHSVVKVDSPHIQKLRNAFAENKPIEWIRVHELPDYVYFPHKRHVAKGVSCETCHGDVKKMDRVEQFAPLSMGWCMQCHRGHSTPKNVLADLPAEVKSAGGAHIPVAPTNCNTCHN